MTRFISLLFVALVVGFAALAYAGLDDGKAAYGRVDGAEAYKEFKVLAERGDQGAAPVGVMHSEAEGVPRDCAEGVTGYRQAADQGSAAAQFDLGVMYYEGTIVPQDYVQAHTWFSLAAAQGYPSAEDFRDSLAEKMTPAQIAEAQRLAREWKPKDRH
jgi:hypothetical protein